MDDTNRTLEQLRSALAEPDAVYLRILTHHLDRDRIDIGRDHAGAGP